MKVCIMGLGGFGGGVGAARYFAMQGHDIVVSDIQPAPVLARALKQLSDFPEIQLSAGGHREDDIMNSDLVVVNPAVPDHLPLLQRLRCEGRPWTTECQLTLESIPSRIVAVTGTLGKTTTAILTADILGAHHKSRVIAGGNMGGSLLDEIPNLTPDDLVVMEMSSFQLSRLNDVTPGVIEAAALTNISPDHDERHGGFEGYIDAKLRLLSLLSEDAALIVGNPLPDRARSLIRESGVRVQWLENTPLRDEYREALTLHGACALQNASMALALAEAVAGEMPSEAVKKGLSLRKGVEHRLESLGMIGGISFYNDSKATTPAATAEAIRTLAAAGRVIHLIVGGSDKGIGHAALQETAHLCESIACMGQVGPGLHESLTNLCHKTTLHPSLSEALTASIGHSAPGESILFSPGHASHDAFQDYRERGRAFKGLVLGAPRSLSGPSDGVFPDPFPNVRSEAGECYD